MATNPWIETFPPRPDASFRLFCFPHAGGAAQFFRTWAKKLPEWIEVCPLQYPGRWSRHAEALRRDAETLVGDVVGALEGELGKPFAFFGNSMGGMLAYESTRKLRAEGRPTPSLLAVSAVAAPLYAGSGTPVHAAPDEAIVQRLRRLGGSDEIISHPDILKTFLPILRADLQIIETYRWIPGEKLKSPILALAGTEDPEATPAKMEAWREQTEAKFSLETIPGGHFFIQSREDEVIGIVLREIESVYTNPASR